MSPSRPPLSALGWLVSLWGILGVTLLIGSAVVRLSPMAIEALTGPLRWYHWAALVPWLAFMLVSEGYRGFQQAFSPRVAARARWLGEHPAMLRGLLAPLFCMGFFGATKKRQLVTWILTSAIVGVVLLVRLLEQPWRGIVDCGVVAGLLWGLIALWIFAAQALAGSRFTVNPELSPALETNTPATP